MKGATIVNRSVCLLGSVLCTLVYFQFTSPLRIYPLVLLLPILNKGRKSGHEGSLEFQGLQVLLFALGGECAIIYKCEISGPLRNSTISWS